MTTPPPPADATSHRAGTGWLPVGTRRRRQVAVLGSLVVVTMMAAGAVSWWTRPAPDWACGPDDLVSGCRHQVVLDLDDLISGPWFIQSDAFDVAPDGALAAVGLTGRSDGGRARRFALGLFDTASGRLEMVVETGEAPGAGIDQVAFSPDGTLLAAVLYQGDRWTVVVYRRDGSRAATPLEQSGDEVGSCAGRLGLSVDNRLVQCGSTVFDLDGEVVERLDDETPYADYDGGGLAWSTSGLRARPRADGVVIDGDRPGGRPVRIDPGPIRIGDPWISELAFSPDGSVLARFASARRAWSPWSLDGPRAERPASQLELYDAASGELLMKVMAGPASSLLAWTADGQLTMLDEKGPLLIYDWRVAVDR